MDMITIVMEKDDIQYVLAPNGIEIQIIDKKTGLTMELREDTITRTGQVRYK